MIPSNVHGHESRSIQNSEENLHAIGAVVSRQLQVVTTWKKAGAMWLVAGVLALVGALNQSAIASGWSDFVPSPDSRIIYVSSSRGNDNNSGLSPQEPVRTINAGYQKLRNGFPDWMLLRRGDTWVNEGFGSNVWNKGGRSDEEPMRLAAYGSSPDRPRLLVSGDGFICHHNRSNVAITGIHFESSNGGNDGFRIIMGYGENWLIEDCKIEGFQNNMNLQGFGTPGEIHNMRIRRCVVVDAASTGSGHSQGIFAHNIKGLLIEECVIDHNGWSQNTNPNAAGYPTVFNHNMYITTYTTDAVVRRNIVSNASSHGVQLRCGGELRGNVFSRNPLAILLGGGDPNPDTHTYGVTGVVHNNVVLEGRDINSSTPRGFGIDLSNIGSASVRNNIIANVLNANQVRPLTFIGAGYGSGVGVQNTTVRDNIIYNWRGTVHFSGSNLANITFNNNDVQVPNNDWIAEHNNSGTISALSANGNRWHTNASNHQWVLIAGNWHSLANWKSMIGDSSSTATQVNYPDPARTLGTYNAVLGGANSHDAFMAEARQQSRSNWRREYTANAVRAYIREGFGMD